MTVEVKLWTTYEQARTHWNEVFMDALLAAKLPSYLQVPREALLVAVGKSMDLLVAAVRDRDMEGYIAAQRENFRARVKAGIRKEDLHAGQKIASGVLEQLVQSVPVSEAERRALWTRAQRLMLLTTSALTEVLLEK